MTNKKQILTGQVAYSLCYIVIPSTRSTRFCCRSFCVCGPTIWNKLPQDLWSTDTREQFKQKLKSWLFECAYVISV